MNRVLPTEALALLRSLGDPVLEKMPDAERSVERLRLEPDLLSAAVMPDPERLFIAQRLYGQYTAEISGALLLAALPQSYATAYGAGVLGAHGQLATDLTRRIGRTAEFLVTVLQQGENNADDQYRLWDWRRSTGASSDDALPWVKCLNLRIRHQRVRDTLTSSTDTSVKELLSDTENTMPLNQEDLLGMLLMFSFVVFEILDQYGITWTADQQEAYLHLWDVVGGYLAIGSDLVKAALQPIYEVPGDWLGLRPPTIDRSHCLVEQIRDHQWVDPSPKANVSGMSWTALRAGRVLTRALLDELEAGMPPLLKPLPIAVMRALNPKVVRDRLNLGSNGVVLRSFSLMPTRRERVGAFTSIESPNRIAGRVLRTLANDVTARASVHLGEKFDLHMPGAPDWHYVP